MTPLGWVSKGTHHTDTVLVRVRSHVFNDIFIRHPFGHHLKRINHNTKALEDVWMIQSRPCHDLSIELLGDISQPRSQVKLKSFTHFLCLLEFHHLDAYPILAGTPLHMVEFPHPHLRTLVYFVGSAV